MAGANQPDLATLIHIKLAARRQRWNAFADVADLIRANNLDESFVSRLEPAFHTRYFSCLEEVRRDEQWHRLQDEKLDSFLRQAGDAKRNSP